MGVVELILLGVQSISTILNNPKIGGSSVRMDEASELLGLLATLIAEGDDAYDDLKAFTEEVQEMADRGIGPTPTQWENIRARQQAAHDRLQAVKEELLAEEEEEDDDESDTNPGSAGEGEGQGDGTGAEEGGGSGEATPTEGGGAEPDPVTTPPDPPPPGGPTPGETDPNA